MSPDVGTQGRPTGDATAHWRIQFWALQVLELGVAFLLITQSVHVGRGAVLVAGGAVFGILALTADGPLGVLRVCGQRLHVVVVAGAALALGALSLVPSLRPDLEGLLVIAGAVVAIVFLATRTVTSPGRSGRRGRRTGRGPVIDATATVSTPAGPEPNPDADGPSGDVDSAIRRAGRTTGAAAAAGKRAVDEHRPQVEDQVKRTLRGAGRLAGKLTGPRPPTDPAP